MSSGAAINPAYASLAPEAASPKMRARPAASNASRCRAAFWSLVEKRAWPIRGTARCPSAGSHRP
jgi:hypothetical protein